MLSMDDPISCVVEEARRNLKPGEHLWWVSNSVSSPLTIRLWNTLRSDEKKILVSSAFAFFPVSILGGPEADYSDFVVWLSQKYSILHPCVRDSFSAGGRVAALEFGSGFLEDVPKIFKTLRSHIPQVLAIILNDVSAEDWAGFYRCKVDECDTSQKRFAMWRAIVEPLLVDRIGGEEYAVNCIKSFLDDVSNRPA